MADRRRTPGKRRRSRIRPEDDRPRGYEPTRMRRLWQDIDQARDKLGLGGASNGARREHGWDAWLGWVSELVEEASTQVSSLPGQVRAAAERLPGARTCQAMGDGALALARKLPVIGTVLTLLPDRSDDES